jgi:MFS transporter, MHS family, shikimate and dehydroshikimate transport protein
MPKVAAASFVGGLLEWYDFYIFAIATALVFGDVFFPPGNPLVNTMAAFGAFAAGFLARPLGGAIFGHIGDRVGRKACLLATLLIIGLCTFLIGLLPSYEKIGLWAPAGLVFLRIMQGIGLGGEYGGASLMTIEHAPLHQRGFWGSLPQVASPAGLLLANSVFGACALLPANQFLAWGWRVPFLLCIVMLAVAIYIRVNIAETPEFRRAELRAEKSRAPLLELWRTHRRNLLLASGVRLSETVASNLIKSFGLTYATLYLGLMRDTALAALMAASLVGLAAMPLFGLLGDRIGARGVTLLGNALLILLALPFFAMLGTRDVTLVWLSFIALFTLGPMLLLSVQATFFTQLFRTSVRYSALSAAYQVSSILGGFTPLIALALLRWSDGTPWPVAASLAAVAAVSFSCALVARGRI